MITEDFINTRLEKDYNLVLAMKTDYRADVDLIEYDHANSELISEEKF